MRIGNDTCVVIGKLRQVFNGEEADGLISSWRNLTSVAGIGDGYGMATGVASDGIKGI
jgi:hypothetical protein